MINKSCQRRDKGLGKKINPASTEYWKVVRSEFDALRPDDDRYIACHQDSELSKARARAGKLGVQGPARIDVEALTVADTTAVHCADQEQLVVRQLQAPQTLTIVPVFELCRQGVDPDSVLSSFAPSLQDALQSLRTAQHPLSAAVCTKAVLGDRPLKQVLEQWVATTNQVVQDSGNLPAFVQYDRPCGALCRSHASKAVKSAHIFLLQTLERQLKSDKCQKLRLVLHATAASSDETLFSFLCGWKPAAGGFPFRANFITCVAIR